MTSKNLRLIYVGRDLELRIISLLVRANEIAEEVIFVDAGSNDRTMELASEFGCKILNYPDNEITIRKIIEKNLRNYHGLTPEVVNIILQNTNLDRDKVNNEIEKIQSCFKDRKIDLDKILLILIYFNNSDITN